LVDGRVPPDDIGRYLSQRLAEFFRQNPTFASPASCRSPGTGTPSRCTVFTSDTCSRRRRRRRGRSS